MNESLVFLGRMKCLIPNQRTAEKFDVSKAGCFKKYYGLFMFQSKKVLRSSLKRLTVSGRFFMLLFCSPKFQQHNILRFNFSGLSLTKYLYTVNAKSGLCRMLDSLKLNGSNGTYELPLERILCICS